MKSYSLLLLILFACCFSIGWATPFVYVPNFDLSSHSVSVIDTATNTVIATIDMGVDNLPFFAAVSPDSSTVYVSCYNINVSSNGTVQYIDVASNTVLGSIIVGEQPRYIAITADGTTAYVAMGGDNVVQRIDLTTKTVVTGTGYPIAVGPSPWGLALTLDDSYLYAVNSGGGAGGNSLSIIETASNTVTPFSLVASNPSGFPHDIVITPNGAKAYVSNNVFPFGNTSRIIPLTITSPATPVVGTLITAGGQMQGSAVAPDGSTAYFSSGVNPLGLVVVNTTTDSASSASITVLSGIVITPDGSKAYVTNFSPGTVYPIALPALSAGTPIVTASGSQYPAIASPPPPPPPPTPNDPTKVTGSLQKNIFLNTTEYLITITWTEGDVEMYDETVAYNIYHGNTLVGTVSANDPLCFRTCFGVCGCRRTFFVAAVDGYGTESNRIPVEVLS